MSRVAGIDLGTTRIKLGCVHGDGAFQLLFSRTAPRLQGERPARFSDARDYAVRAEALLEREPPAGDWPLGLSSQRSSFVLWERASGEPVTPLISWQDTRASGWCAQRKAHAPWIWRLTGLPLSPHYAGPTLAWLLASDPDLNARARRGELLFGTLDSFVIWRWSGGAVHATCTSIAARTLLCDWRSASWHPDLLAFFGVPRHILPEIRADGDFAIAAPGGWTLRACSADQTAAAHLVLAGDADALLANMGTGTFVLRIGAGEAPPGYVRAGFHLRRAPDPTAISFWEAAINAGAGLGRYPGDGSAPGSPGPAKIKAPFAVPDRPGLGAPHWRDPWSHRFSAAIGDIPRPVRRGLLWQGFLYRVREVCEGLFPEGLPGKVYLTGGLTASEPLARALARVLPWPAALVRQREMSLAGAAHLASPEHPCAPLGPRWLDSPPVADPEGERYRLWRAWLARALDRD